VQSAAVIGVPDVLRGLVVKAFIVLQPGYEAGDALTAALQDFVRNRLSQHEYPRQVSFVTDLPRTPAGKINRKALRDQEAAAQETA
jgi:acetyl-CoA synthetase